MTLTAPLDAAEGTSAGTARQPGPACVLLALKGRKEPYVKALAAGLATAGCPVQNGADTFWSDELFDHDIVHIQWPEALFGWRQPDAADLQRLRGRLREIRRRAKIVYTLHNETSHHARGDRAAALHELYALVESPCDAMVHLGETSRRACEARPELRCIPRRRTRCSSSGGRN